MEYLQFFANDGVQKLLTDITTTPILKKIENIEDSLKYIADSSHFIDNLTMALQNTTIQELIKDVFTAPLLDISIHNQNLSHLFSELSNLRKEIKLVNTKKESYNTGIWENVCPSTDSIYGNATNYNLTTHQPITGVMGISRDQYESIHFSPPECSTLFDSQGAPNVHVKEEVTMNDSVNETHEQWRENDNAVHSNSVEDSGCSTSVSNSTSIGNTQCSANLEEYTGTITTYEHFVNISLYRYIHTKNVILYMCSISK